MMVIAAGLASIPRETLEAARVDGASEWQVFRRVTVPLLWPVILVVVVTLIINVLKIFDLVLIVPPGNVQDDANVIALELWKVGFGGERRRAGERARRAPVPPRAAGDGLQHPALPRRGDLMAVPTKIDVDSAATATQTVAALGVEPRSTRLARWLSSGPIYVVMVAIGLFWLLPTIGLFFLSLREPC